MSRDCPNITNKRKIKDISQPNRHGVNREHEPFSPHGQKQARAQSPQEMRPPMDRPAQTVRAPASSTRIPPSLASSVSKAGGASTSSAKDSRSTVLVLPPRSAAHYAQHAIPHSRKGKAAIKEHAAPSSAAPHSSTPPEPEQRDLVVSAPDGLLYTPDAADDTSRGAPCRRRHIAHKT